MITGGIISFEDGKKAGEEYAPPKKAAAEIHFSVADGEDHEPIMNQARVYAMNQVGIMLGQLSPPPNHAPPTPKPTKQFVDDGLAQGFGSQESAQEEARAVNDPAAMGDEPAPKRTRGPNKPKAEATKPAADPAAMGEEPVKVATPAPAVNGHDTTDAGLYKAVTALNAKHDNKAAPKITPIIKEFLPENVGVSLKNIPEEKRVAFLDKLAEVAKTW